MQISWFASLGRFCHFHLWVTIDDLTQGLRGYFGLPKNWQDLTFYSRKRATFAQDHCLFCSTVQQYVVVQGSLRTIDSRSQLLESLFSLCRSRILAWSGIWLRRAGFCIAKPRFLNFTRKRIFFRGVRNSDCLTWREMSGLAMAVASRIQLALSSFLSRLASNSPLDTCLSLRYCVDFHCPGEHADHRWKAQPIICRCRLKICLIVDVGEQIPLTTDVWSWSAPQNLMPKVSMHTMGFWLRWCGAMDKLLFVFLSLFYVILNSNGLN